MSSRSAANIFAEVLYGVINSILLVPICISFATIIYRDPFFEDHLPMLIKLVLFSALVHQTVFVMQSTLSFAVGQVQDAGLIFLSTMASSIVNHCKSHGASDTATISTVLVTLSLATGALGLALMLIGRLKLASLVQYLPMPVVGGYLAYIGFFCGQAGLALMAQVQIVSLADWHQLLDPTALMLVAPGVVLGVGLFRVLRTVRHMLALPTFLVAALAAFYLLLSVTGTSLPDAREMGWVAPRQQIGPCYEGWLYFDLKEVLWWVVPTQAASWAAMVVVVAFSSCLDVAAIEMEVQKPLNYNHELKTVGLSNVVSGCLGGYTGSYIFSQTIFNLRARVDSRLTGLVIVLLEGLVFALPFSPMAYVPRALFGGLLLLIATDLCIEWLWGARLKMARTEYAVNLASFIACMLGGVEAGIALGVVFAMGAFILSYAQIPAVLASPVTQSSTVMRTFEERVTLEQARRQVLTLSMQGYIFFGSSVRLLRDAKAALNIDDSQIGTKTADETEKASLLTKTNGAKQNPTDKRKVKSANTPRGGSSAMKISQSDTRSNGSTGNGSTTSASLAIPSSRPKAASYELSYTGSFGSQGSYGSSPPSVSPPRLLVDGEMVASEVQGNGRDTSPLPSNERTRLKLSGLRKNGQNTAKGYSALEQHEEEATGNGTLVMNQGRDAELGLLPPPLGRSLFASSTDKRYGAKHLSKKTTSHVRLCILDFCGATGLDASAARSCFLMLKQTFKTHGILCIFVVSSQPITDLLLAHEVIEASSLEPSSVTPSVAGVPLSALEPVFKNLDDALEWCEEFFLLGQTTAAATAPLMLSPAEILEAAEGTSSSSNEVVKSTPRPPAVSIPENGDEFSSNVSSISNAPGSPTTGGFARHPSYYRTMQATRSPSGAKHPHVDDDAMTMMASSSSTDALVAILEDYLQLPAASSPLRVPSAKTALAQHFKRSLVASEEVLFHRGGAADKLIFLEIGTVDMLVPPHLNFIHSAKTVTSNSSQNSLSSDAEDGQLRDDDDLSTWRRIQRISGGGIAGECGFFLQVEQPFTAVARVASAIWVVDRTAYEALARDQPQLCILVQTALLKSLSLFDSQFLVNRR